MFFMFVFLLINAFATIAIWTIGGDCCSTGVLTDDVDVCCLHYYADGIFCKECPTGYYGANCSQLCPSPYYGNGCIRKCDCYPCHHIYGCMLLTTMQRKHAMQMDTMNDSRVSQIPVEELENVKAMGNGPVVSKASVCENGL